MFHGRAEKKDLQLLVERDPDVPQFVYGDEGKLRQVLINLLGNAIKFTDEGGVVLRIRTQKPLPQVSDTQEGKAVKVKLFVEVEDTGQGIEPDKLITIFEPFVQASSKRQMQEGTGLGLAISRRFVNLMGGDIAVESVLGKKSIFRFDVELTLASAAALVEYQNPRRVIGLEPGQRTFRVLVVEDKLESRTLLVRLLTFIGFEVQEAIDGEEATRLAETWRPDLILMDMRMPVMDGYEATQRIKATPEGKKIIVIATTASVFEHEQDKVFAAGCDDLLTKPFRESKLFEKLEKHLKVAFRYEQIETDATSARKEAVWEFTSDALLALLPEQLSELEKASTSANAKRLNEIIAEIRGKDQTLADNLAQLVKAYRFDKILALVQAVESQKPA
jgi:two-component system sensor histidine kinase/response regulator